MEVTPFGNSAEMNFNLNESSSSSSQQIEEEDEAALIRDYCKVRRTLINVIIYILLISFLIVL